MFSQRKAKNHRSVGGVHTEPSGGRVYCQACGRPVRSKLGSVCHRPVCQVKVLGRAGALDELGE